MQQPTSIATGELSMGRHAIGRTVCRDPGLDAHLRDEGFVVVDLLDPQAAQRLEERCRALHPPTHGWESDFNSGDPHLKRAVYEAIGEAFEPAVERTFVDHHTVLQNFVVNWPGPDGGLILHQHSSMVDEREHRSYILWCAVTEATEENGTLHVVPRSHLVQRGPRPERTVSWADEHAPAILANHLVSIALAPGQALVFDNQLLHCSFANQTDSPRISAVAALLPREAELRFYEGIDGDRVREYALDPDFFIRNQAAHGEWARPEGLECLDERSWEPTVVAPEALGEIFDQGSCAHPAAT